MKSSTKPSPVGVDADFEQFNETGAFKLGRRVNEELFLLLNFLNGGCWRYHNLFFNLV
ncbi:protein of unknown function [Shinella sp. WSC3-e]|nr:protein of unknown function [Shinella sp. WSC3-e]